MPVDRSAASVLISLVTAALTTTFALQSPAERKDWNSPVEPFRVIGNIHYVGAAGVSAFLIVTPEGSLLLDGGLPETAPQIAASIAKLGFGLSDVKFLLNSHAHFDHSGGLAELKRLSGAALVASAGDAPTLRSGAPNSPAVAVDRVVDDGETVTLGSTVLTANVTPGHTRGCTSWSTTTMDDGKPHDVIFYCSTSVVAPLVNNTEYPQIVTDYEQTFRRLRAMRADVFLAPHPAFFRMEAKRERMRAGAPNPFVDRGELARFVDSSERDFRAALAKASKP